VKDGITGTLNAWSMTVTPQTEGASATSAPSELLAADLYFFDLSQSSEEDSDATVQEDIAEYLLYDV